MIVHQQSMGACAHEVRRQAEKVLLIHCSASSPKQWANLEECLSPGFQVCAWALVGHGERDSWSGIGPLTIEAEVEGIRERFATNGGRLHVVGHSYGGAVALRLALRDSNIVQSLTLIEPVCFYLLRDETEHADDYQEVRSVAQDLGASVVQGDYHAGMQRFVDYWSGPDAWAHLSDDQKRKFSARAVHIVPHFEALFSEQISLRDCASLRIPTLILSGTRSPKPTRRISQLLSATIPLSRHQAVEGAGHMAPITHEQQVNSLIIDHVLLNPAKPDACP